jgi:hypothetical protein
MWLYGNCRRKRIRYGMTISNIPIEKLDAVLSLGKIRLLLYEEAAKHIRIKIYKYESLVPKLSRQSKMRQTRYLLYVYLC